tara:strand:+ start:189 stop:878 length:690 start_codon:yes stop_codon:yes gene_type:complete
MSKHEYDSTIKKFWNNKNSYFSSRFSNDLKRQKSYDQEIGLIKKHVKSGNLLDVGCSTGEFIDRLNWSGDCYGMEINDFARSHAEDKGIRFDRNLFNSDNYFDVIIFRGVAHLLDTPFLYFQRAYKSLKPGGYLFFLATPNANSPCYKISNSLHILYKEQTFYVPSDIWLTNACENFGFQTIEKQFPYMSSPYRSFLKDHFLFLLLLFGIKTKHKFSFWKNMMNITLKK